MGMCALADEPLWEAGIGAGWLLLPHYRGSNERRSWVLPVPYFVYRGEILRADKDGARALLFEGERFDLDFSLSASPPTKSKNSQARAGMPNLEPTFEIGPQANLRLASGSDWKVELRVPLRSVITLEAHPRAVGWTVAPVINGDFELHGFSLGVQAGPLWGDQRLHRRVYGVATAFATAERPAYTAPGGYGGWQATAGLSRRFDKIWLGAFIRHDSVAGAAFEASPLVKSRQNTALGIAMAWVFATSDTRVAGTR